MYDVQMSSSGVGNALKMLLVHVLHHTHHKALSPPQQSHLSAGWCSIIHPGRVSDNVEGYNTHCDICGIWVVEARLHSPSTYSAQSLMKSGIV